MPLRNPKQWKKSVLKSTIHGPFKTAERYRTRNPTDVLRNELMDARAEKGITRDAYHLRRAIASTAARSILFNGLPLNQVLPKRQLSFLYTISVELLQQTHIEKVVEDNIKKKFRGKIPETARQKMERQADRTREIMDIIYFIIPDAKIAKEYALHLLELSNIIYAGK
jgi:hypothetical protein